MEAIGWEVRKIFALSWSVNSGRNKNWVEAPKNQHYRVDTCDSSWYIYVQRRVTRICRTFYVIWWWFILREGVIKCLEDFRIKHGTGCCDTKMLFTTLKRYKNVEVLWVSRLACHLMTLCVCIKCHKNALNGFKLQCGQDFVTDRHPYGHMGGQNTVKNKKNISTPARERHH